MDGFVDILIVVVAVGSIIWKAVKGNNVEITTPPPIKDTEGETLPPPYIVMEEEPFLYEEEQHIMEEVSVKETKMVEKPKTVFSPTIPECKPKQEKAETPIAQSLQSAQGSRRAFIYSEIFNRKYE